MALDTTKLAFLNNAQITVDGTDIGGTEVAPTVTVTENIVSWDPVSGGGPMVGGETVDKANASADLVFSEFTAERLRMGMAGALATAGNALAAVKAGLDTTLAADPAAGATNVKLTSVTTVNVGDFVRIAPAALPTSANSEVVRAVTVGTVGAGTGMDLVTDTGGGLVLDHANAETVKTVNGTLLAAPIAAGAKVANLVSVSDWAPGDILQVGYAGHYEDRTVVTVGTAGAGGTGITFDQAFQRDHAAGEWVYEIAATASTSIAWEIGPIPASAYKDVVISGMLVDGTPVTITIKNAIGIKALAISLDRKYAGIPVTLRGTYLPSAPKTVPFNIVYG